MITEEKCYSLICDNCHKLYQANYTDYSMWAEPNCINPEDDYWHVDEEKHYCPDCFSINDDDVITIKNIAPLFKVISEFPNNKDFPLDKIIEFEPWNGTYWQHKVSDCQGDRMWLSDFFEQYPLIFERYYK